MKKIKKELPLILLYLIASFLVLLTVNYSLGTVANDKDFPYGLGIDYIEFKSLENEEFDFSEVINPDLYRNTTLVAKTNDSSVIGVFDPAMRYYHNSSKMTYPAKFRYFSQEDYRNENNVSVVNSLYCNVDGVEVIHCLEISSLPKEVRILKNVYAIQSNQIEGIFLRNDNKQEVLEIRKELEKVGFVLVEKKYQSPDIFSSFLNSFLYGRYQQFISIATIALIALYAATFLVYGWKMKKVVLIHQKFGGTIKKIYVDWIKQFLIMMIELSFVSYIAVIYMEKVLNSNYIDLIAFTKIQLFMIFFNLLLFSILFLLLQAENKLRRGR